MANLLLIIHSSDRKYTGIANNHGKTDKWMHI